jgi:hypothetical protein
LNASLDGAMVEVLTSNVEKVYGLFAGEARAVDDDYTPETVNSLAQVMVIPWRIALAIGWRFLDRAFFNAQ